MPPHTASTGIDSVVQMLSGRSFWLRLLWWMLAWELLLVILNIWTPAIIARSVHLDRESNLVVWFSSAQLLLASLTALLVSLQESAFLKRLPWYLLALLLLMLSIDETAMLHESVGPRLALLHSEESATCVHWLTKALPFVIVAVGFLCWLIVYCFRRNSVARRLMIVALCCWCISLTGECIQHYSESLLAGFNSPHCYKAVWIIEETMEMIGASLMWCALGLLLCARVTTSRAE